MRIATGLLAGILLAASLGCRSTKTESKPVEQAQAVPPAQPAAQPQPVAQVPAAVAEAPSPAPAAGRQAAARQIRRPTPTPVAPVRAAAPAPAPAAQPPAAQAPVAPVPAEPVPAPASTPSPAPAPEPPPPPKPNTVTLVAGTLLPVRMGETVSAERHRQGDTFTATLDRPLVIDGFVIAERGARVEGRVVESDRGGRVRGVSSLSVELTRLTTADGQNITIRTEPFRREAQAERGRDAAKVGVAAGIGAAIGAIAGGGRGAAIGAGVGGAAGTGGVMATRGKAAELPVETRISFRVNEPVTITERPR